MLQRFFVLLFVLNISLALNAANEKISIRVVGKDIYKKNDPQTPNLRAFSFELADSKSPFQSANNYWVTNSVARIKFGKDNYYILNNYPDSISYEITLRNIRIVDKNNVTTTINKKTIILKVTMEELNQDLVIVSFNNCNSISFDIEKVEDITTTHPNQHPSNYFAVQENVFMEVEIETERFYRLEQNPIVTFAPRNNIGGASELDLFWSPIEGAEEYELEWNFNSFYINQSFSSNHNFKNNSTRIKTKNQNYKIPLIYGKGTVSFRVRAIGKRLNSIDTEYSNWSNIDSYNTTQNFESSKNWIYNVSYAEDGLKKENIAFFDGSQRQRQEQAKSNTEGELIVGETIYDRLGRPSIQTIPAPINNAAFGFIENLNKDTLGQKYSWNSFDKTSISKAYPMSTVSGSSMYYSPQNTDNDDLNAYIPDAQKYPFSQTIYTPDGTGRVASQSIPGRAHSELNNRTRYAYGDPDPMELDKMFGTDVGNYKYYSKKMIVDPDGVTTLEYYDKNNRLIATNTVGSQEENLLEIDGDSAIDQEILIQTEKFPFFNSNRVTDNGLIFTHAMLIPKKTVASIDYNFATSEAKFCKESVCYNCVYDLKIYLIRVDETIDTLFTHKVKQFNVENLLDCNENMFSMGTEVVTLYPGKYILTKELVLNHTHTEELLENFIRNAPCVLKPGDFMSTDTIGLNLCNSSLNDCINTLGINYTEHCEKFGTDALTQESYIQAIKECSLLGTNLTITERLLLTLAGDMKPGGQYGEYYKGRTVDGKPLCWANSFTSIYGYAKGNGRNYAGDIIIANNPTVTDRVNWRTPVKNKLIDEYYDDFACTKISKIRVINEKPAALNSSLYDITINGDTFVSPKDISFTDFVKLWKPSWAYSLVEFHPEYPYYKWCKEVLDLSGSERFENHLRDLNSFEKANNEIPGFNDPNNPYDLIKIDPFIKYMDENPTTNSAQYVGEFIKTIENYYTKFIGYHNTQTMSLKQYIAIITKYGLQYCNDPSSSPLNAPIDQVLIHDTLRNNFWRIYREIYINEKSKLIEKIAHEYAIKYNSNNLPTDLIGGYNKCIACQPRDFSPNENNFIGSNGWHNAKQPCSANTYRAFANKTKRFSPSSGTLPGNKDFADPEGIVDELNSLTEFELMQRTGQCKSALMLETFINEIIREDVLGAEIDVTTLSSFMPYFHQQLYPRVSCNIPVIWRGELQKDELMAYLDLSGEKQEFLYLNDPYHNAVTLKYLFKVRNLLFTKQIGNKYFFRLIAILKDEDGHLYQETLYGWTILPINDCYEKDFKESISTTFMQDLVNLMSNLASTGELDNNIITSPTPISTGFITPDIAMYFKKIHNELLSSGLTWLRLSNINSNEAEFELNSPICGRAFRITLIGVEFIDIKDIKSLSTANPFWDPITNSFNLLAHTELTPRPIRLSCSVNWLDPTTASMEIVPVGGLANRVPLSCRTPEYLDEGLRTWLNAALTKGFFVENTISTLPNFKFLEDYYYDAGEETRFPLKPEAIFLHDNITENTSTPYYFFENKLFGPYQPGDPTFDYTSNTYYKGKIKRCVVGSKPPIEVTCNISFKPPYEGFDFSKILTFLELRPRQTFKSGDDDYTYDFTAKVIYFDGVKFATETITGSSCMPLKVCNSCERTFPLDFEDCKEHFINYTHEVNDNPAFTVPLEEYCSHDYNYWHPSFIKYYNYFGLGQIKEPTTSPYYVTFPDYCTLYLGTYLDEYMDFIKKLSQILKLDVISLGNFHVTLQEFSHSGMQNCYKDYLNALALESEPLTYMNLQTWSINNECDERGKPFPYPCPAPPYTVPIPLENHTTPIVDVCSNFLNGLYEHNGMEAYNRYIDSVKAAFRREYKGQCLLAKETLSMTKQNFGTVFTLYYYDRAGNLVKTVPPEGVHLFTSTEAQQVAAYREANIHYVPAHTMASLYRFNTMGQVILQNTPDAGNTRFYYDYAGRLRFSQDQKQINKSNGNNQYYSYSIYDPLSRPIESGESFAANGSNLFPSPLFLKNTLLDNTFPAVNKSQIVASYWDDASNNSIFTLGQTNLRNRIAAVKSFPNETAQTNGLYSYATHYTYDVHGNVKELIQQNGLIPIVAQQVKRIIYDYDLVSGNMRMISYQPNEPDQFYHKYKYDVDNRITQVFTSSDNVIWDEDASYFYYRHGPLARTELGELKVQGLDYVYTLQGWLKGVNSNTLVSYRDPGKDGDIFNTSIINYHKNVARDAFAYSLGYYHGDYHPINPTPYSSANPTVNGGPSSPADVLNLQFAASITGTQIETNRRDLMSGNISHMVTTLPNPVNYSANNAIFASPLATAYRYDVLNRIKEMNAHDQINLTTNTWNTSGNGQTITDMYKMSLSYTKNGNITNLNRNSATQSRLTIDQLSYKYAANKNQLQGLSDAITPIANGADISGTHKYEYDAIGNLTSDETEEIANIEWNLRGKLTKITRIQSSSKPNLEFAYDPMGNRILKIVKKAASENAHMQPTRNQENWEYTWYVRDAQGNIMATYTMNYAPDNASNKYIETLSMASQDIYGSSRLGTRETNILLNTRKFKVNSYNADGSFNQINVSSNGAPIVTKALPLYHTFGSKQYELTNHLGNVLLTVSDNRRAIANLANPLQISHYEPYISSITDYYPFGMPMAERSYQSNKYRFGLNGQEKVDEITGHSGSHNTALFWEYDTRLGRRWNLDPKPQIGISDYAAFGNSPLRNIDPLGDIWKNSFDNAKQNAQKNVDNDKASLSNAQNDLSYYQNELKNCPDDVGMQKQVAEQEKLVQGYQESLEKNQEKLKVITELYNIAQNALEELKVANPALYDKYEKVPYTINVKGTTQEIKSPNGSTTESVRIITDKKDKKNVLEAYVLLKKSSAPELGIRIARNTSDLVHAIGHIDDIESGTYYNESKDKNETDASEFSRKNYDIQERKKILNNWK